VKVELQEGEEIQCCPMCAGPSGLYTTTIGVVQVKVKGKTQIWPQDSLFWCRCEDVDCGVTMPAVSGRTKALARWNRRAG
jgi:hypothetical protein